VALAPSGASGAGLAVRLPSGPDAPLNTTTRLAAGRQWDVV
jgi:hypothetical protein